MGNYSDSLQSCLNHKDTQRNTKASGANNVSESKIKYIHINPRKKVSYEVEEKQVFDFNDDNNHCPFMSPQKYIGRHKEKKHTAILHKYCKFKHLSQPVNMYPWIKTRCYKIEKINGKSIIVLHIKNDS